MFPLKNDIRKFFLGSVKGANGLLDMTYKHWVPHKDCLSQKLLQI